MSKSRKRFPVTTWVCCKSQKKGKQMASRRFRRNESRLLAMHEYEKLPLRSIELTSPWDLGGDGKQYFGHLKGAWWYEKEMRK